MLIHVTCPAGITEILCTPKYNVTANIPLCKTSIGCSPGCPKTCPPVAAKGDHHAQCLPPLEETSPKRGNGAIPQGVGSRGPRGHLYPRCLAFPDLPPNESFITSLKETCLHLLAPIAHIYSWTKEKKPTSWESSHPWENHKPHRIMSQPATSPCPQLCQGKNAVSKATATSCFINATGREPHVHVHMQTCTVTWPAWTPVSRHT